MPQQCRNSSLIPDLGGIGAASGQVEVSLRAILDLRFLCQVRFPLLYLVVSVTQNNAASVYVHVQTPMILFVQDCMGRLACLQSQTCTYASLWENKYEKQMTSIHDWRRSSTTTAKLNHEIIEKKLHSHTQKVQ